MGKLNIEGLKILYLSNPILKKTASLIVKPFTNSEQRANLSRKVNNIFIDKIPFPDEIREDLINIYREDILKTQELLDINLSHWLKIS